MINAKEGIIRVQENEPKTTRLFNSPDNLFSGFRALSGVFYQMKVYRKKVCQPMRPYTPGEDMSGISVSSEDTLEVGGMIAVNPKNEKDQWYIAKKFFEDNYEEIKNE